ncbi:MAG: CehA/McbA family metallohydrolase, partial [Clostridium sp.]
FYTEEPTPRSSKYSENIVKLSSLKVNENISLEVGEAKALSISYNPENTTEKGVKFESLNEEIATVDKDGNVTGVKDGETIIKVTSIVREDIASESKIIVTKALDKKGPEILNVYPFPSGNIGDLRRPEIKATITDDSGVSNESIKLYLDGNSLAYSINDNVISYKVEQDLSDGQHTIKIEAKDILGNLSEEEWNFTVGEVKKNLYFGQLHSHTNLSDGTGTVDEAYQYAENVAKVDFLAITDHSNWFDNDSKANIADGSASTKWNTGKEAANKYNKNGKFVAIYGYEMSWSGSTGGYGHINTFNTEGFETRTNSKMDLKAYYNALKTQPQSLAQFNHPGKTFGDFSDFAHYDEEIDKLINLVEVGNGEGAIRSSGQFQSYEYYTRALDKGWHLAPSNNQDNHKGKWGNANTGRTVIEASELSRDSIYDAIRNRRVYATEDENLRVSYEVNGNTMGSILPEMNKLDFIINIEDIDKDDTIKKISIIGDGGKIVKSIDNVNSTNKEWKFSLEESV